MASRPSTLSYAQSQLLYEYPSPARSDSVGHCQMSESTLSPTTNERWTVGSVNTHNLPRSSQSSPNILSTEYDPFAHFDNSASSTYSHDIHRTTGAAEVSILPVSPALSSGSLRSSASGLYNHDTTTNSLPPQIKMEEPMDYDQNPDAMLMSSTEMTQNLMVTSSSYGETLNAGYYHNQSALAWPKMEYSNAQDLPSISSLAIPSPDRHLGSHHAGSTTAHERFTGTAQRTRQPRRLTTREDANFQCPIKGCGKLFGRSYNFKAHMETHDAGREYPFSCPETGCSKKFVRKTDLSRHHQSVHLKQRNHKCDYCGRFFARKDTLRRHMEDGCSKRFDIETLNLRPQSYSHGAQSSMRAPPQTFDTKPSLSSYNSSAQFSPPPPPPLPVHHHQEGSTMTSDTSQYYERQDYITDEHNQHSAWPH